MNYKKIIITSISLSLFFLFYWFLSNSQYYSMPDNLFSSDEILYNMNNSAYGYVSLLAYTTIYLLPFLFFLKKSFVNDSLLFLIRHSNRNRLFIKRFYNLFSISIIFCILHIIINILFSFTFFNINFLIEKNYFISSLFHLLIIISFYIQVGFSFYIIYDLINNLTLSLFITLLIYSGVYFFHKLTNIVIWPPITDLIVLGNLIDGSLSIVNLLIILLRQSMFVFIFYNLSCTLFNRKDFLCHEI